MSEAISSTEAIRIDLIALRSYHLRASMDGARSPSMRHFHRGQAGIIGRKIPTPSAAGMTLRKLALLGLLLDRAERVRSRRQLRMFWNTEAVEETAFAWEWNRFCAEARKQVAEALREKL